MNVRKETVAKNTNRKADKIIPIGLKRLKEHLDTLCIDPKAREDETIRESILKLCERVLRLDPDDLENHVTYEMFSRDRRERWLAFYRSLFAQCQENMHVCWGFCLLFGTESEPRNVSAEEVLGILPKSATHYVEVARTIISLYDQGFGYSGIDPETFLDKAVELNAMSIEANRWLGLISNDADKRLLHLRNYYDETRDEKILVFLGNEYVRKGWFEEGLTCYAHFPIHEIYDNRNEIPLHRFEIACAEAWFLLTKTKNEKELSGDEDRLRMRFREYATPCTLEAMRKKYGFPIG